MLYYKFLTRVATSNKMIYLIYLFFLNISFNEYRSTESKVSFKHFNSLIQ